MASTPIIHGTVAPGFEKVWSTFVQNFTRRGEVGASFCATVDGETVVDLWGGWADVEAKRPWAHDTMAILFSSTKGLAASALLRLHDEGRLDHDALVTDYWPEFGWAGKQNITVRTLLNHRSGVSGLDRDLSLSDLEKPEFMAAAVVNQVPMWAPGSAQGYGAIAWGILAAELFRRAAGESIGTYLKREIAEPLGADVHLGLDPAHDHRVATTYPATTRERLTQIVPRALLSPKVEGRVYRSVLYGGPQSIGRRAFGNPKALGPSGIQNFNTTRVHRMELPWGNGIGSARGLARVYAAIANGGAIDGKRIWSEEAIRQPQPRLSFEYDQVMLRDMGFSLGFVKEGQSVFGSSPSSYGHPGAGGVLGWADPEKRVSIGYVMNKMDFHVRSPRAMALSRAVFESL